MGRSAAAGCAVVDVRLFTRVFFSVTGAGVASSSAGGVSSATAAGFSLGGSVEISILGSNVRFVGRCVGVAFTVTEGSKSVGEAASWARANCDPANAAAVHRRKTQADRILACNARLITVNGIASQAISPSFLRPARCGPFDNQRICARKFSDARPYRSMLGATVLPVPFPRVLPYALFLSLSNS